ncbi:hypothetical protein PPACK8108_LOCUS19174 [Phakopsora pachyrhizi]|uniref:Uncharacterized protein n=1 Tax=Phakopsora pachyrhizi TaxID=170000 RepID=A0AAV0BBN1_PHAPC|nr:hypothetical protein PPACK8108_LOCUS19174 [Phakopsora pachyrhizi]
MLAQSRVTRAKKMMTPFVLRRKKPQALKDPPNRIEKIVHCEMEDQEGKIYKEIFCKSKRYIVAMEVVWIDLTMDDNDNEVSEKPSCLLGPLKLQEKNPLKEQKRRSRDQQGANHPMLFRKLYNDRLIGKMSKESLKELKFYKQDAGLIIEDIDVMKDFEQHVFASCYKFTQMLSILYDVMKTLGYNYLILTGSTSVDEQQPLVDQFTKDFSLSHTKDYSSLFSNGYCDMPHSCKNFVGSCKCQKG